MKKTLHYMAWVLVLVGLMPVYWAIGTFAAEIYVEIKFDEMRWGPHETMPEVDRSLAWFRRDEITESLIPPYYLRGRDIRPVLSETKVQFVAYHIGRFGFVVVFDTNGRKLAELKTDI